MSKTFNIIVCDPPWKFSDCLRMSDGVKRGAEDHYKVMTNDEIKNLPVGDIVDPEGSLLALWVPATLLQTGLDVMKAWGFTYKQLWVWAKLKNDPFKDLKGKKDIVWDEVKVDNFLFTGMGRLARNANELILVGTKGSVYKKLKNKAQKNVFFAKNTKHSVKPEVLQDKLEIMFPDVEKKIELFSRRQRPGWVCLGNESPETLGEDIRDSLNKLVNS